MNVKEKDWIIHDKYGDDSDRNPNNYDICIIKTSQNIRNVAHVRCSGRKCVSSACLPDAEPVHGKSCWIAGWGTVERSAEGDHKGEFREAGLNIFTEVSH